MALRVAFDEQIFLLQRNGGISRYFVEIIKQFQSHPELGIEPILLNQSAWNDYFLSELNSDVRKVKSRAQSILELLAILLSRQSKTAEYDIVHHTFYLPGFLGRFKGVPKVSTLFDMIPEASHSSGLFNNPHFSKKKYLSQSEAILSISDSSTRDMYKFFDFQIPVATTYLGVSPQFSPRLPALPSLPDKYFIYIGNRNGYKDFTLALAAFAEVSQKHNQLGLVIVGGGALSQDETLQIGKLGISHRIFRETLDSDQLPRAYSNALALIHTSRLEGFGLPLVEAMASGIPVLAASTSVNREIAGDIANYFTVGSASGLQRLMLELLETPSRFESKIVPGLGRAKKFSWYACASKTAGIYKEIFERGRAI